MQIFKGYDSLLPFWQRKWGVTIPDKSRNIVTNRRSLISEPKYNSINVDDDYYDILDKEKRMGRFYRNDSPYKVGNNNLNNNHPQSNTSMNFSNIQAFQQENVGRPYSISKIYE